MHALAGQGVEVQGEARDEGLALAGLHLGDLALVQHDASDELYVEVAEADRPPPCLAAHRERFDQQLVEVVPVLGLLSALARARAQSRVVALLELRLARVDGRRPRQTPSAAAFV